MTTSVRASSVVKLTTGRTNLDYTFVAGTPLDKVLEELLTHLAFDSGANAVTAVSDRVTQSLPPATK